METASPPPKSDMVVKKPSGRNVAKGKSRHDAEYGVLDARNIDRVSFGDHDFNTWYGNSAYFLGNGDLELGIETYARNPGARRTLAANANELWLSRLHVCDFCFKYTSDENKMVLHRTVCELAKPFPPLGKLVYADMKAPYLIKRFRGFRHELFCQNLALFGKLFLDDKSVYYNVGAFDFYVLYGHDYRSSEDSGSRRFKPMGFFSKEVNAWEADNNLACICIFPPFQRLGLGSLLIEFLYALAAVTANQTWLGPEFPLSPYGKVTYLRFWSKRLAFILANDFDKKPTVTLPELSGRTGFRKDDILFTLEYMGILFKRPESETVTLSMLKLQLWCKDNNVNTQVLGSMMNPLCLLI